MAWTLSPEQRALWRARGWLVIADALNTEVAGALDRWIAEISRPADVADERLHYFEETPSGPAICRTERFLADHAELARFMTEGALPEIVAALSGEAMLLYKEKVNHKQPGGAGFAPHQDATAYPYVQLNVTALVPADPMTPENGCLEFSAFPEQVLLPVDDGGCIAESAASGLRFEPVPVVPGEILFFNSYAPHRSGPNLTHTPRRALYLTYSRAADGDLRARYYAERARRLEARRDSAEGISIIRHFQGKTAKEPGQ